MSAAGVIRNVCVFCGAARGNQRQYADAARDAGKALAQAGLGMVYGGAHIGLMGICADAALGAGGTVVGVIPRALADREVAHTGLTKLHIVDSMHERKALMADLSDAFIALPGGYGTLEELCESITWAQLGIHTKPIAMLNTGNFYYNLCSMFDVSLENGFMTPEDRALVRSFDDVAGLMNYLSG